MPRRYYLGLDQGTTGTTALLLDENWNQIARGHKDITQHYPQAGWVEHDPEELYTSLLEATAQALRESAVSDSEIRCMGLDNQGETVVVWDKETGKPVYPAIVWQDRRTSPDSDALNALYEDEIKSRSGVKLDAYFGATKIRWILKNIPEAQALLAQGRLLAGPTDAWMIWKLTGGKVFASDCVTASRTCMMNLETRQWDDRLLEIFEIPRSILPEIRENACDFGVTLPEAFLDAAIPITGSIVDQQAALLGQGCSTPGTVKTTYGTGCFMLMNTGSKPYPNKDGLLVTPAWVKNSTPTYALDGGVYIAGAAVQWLRDGLRIINSPAQSDAMALSVADNGGVYFVPAFSGLAAPYWDSYARGTIVGITAGVTAAHIARATLEATAYQVRDIYDILQRIVDIPIRSMRVDGGSTASRFLMQFQADLLGVPVEIPVITETTALGAAYLAAVGCGDLNSLEAPASLWQRAQIYEPRMSQDQRDFAMAEWHRAVERSRGWVQPK